MPVHAIEAPTSLSQMLACGRPRASAKAARNVRAMSSSVVIGPRDRPVSRTIIIAGQLKLYPTDELLLEWRGRGMEPDDGGIEVGPRLGINRRYLAFPRVTYRLAELANVLAVVAKMHGELLPADRRGSLGIDARQPIREPSVKVEGRRRVPDMPDGGLVQRHGVLPEVLEEPLGHIDFADEGAVLAVNADIFVRQLDLLDPELPITLVGASFPIGSSTRRPAAGRAAP